MKFVASMIKTADAGRGGNGAGGQLGQPAGFGGAGAQLVPPGCGGGDGAAGGNGGAGGGGAGGISVGILFKDAMPEIDMTTMMAITVGMAGAKGLGGASPLNDGVAGTTQTMLKAL